MRILIIEDEQDVAALVEKAMAEQKHAVDIAHDGITGQELALSEPYDLLILDIILPRKDGLAVLKTLRTVGDGDALPARFPLGRQVVEALNAAMPACATPCSL